MKPYFEQGNIKLYHGKCEEIMPYLPQVDLTVTSPPYDNLRVYEGCTWNFAIFRQIARCLYAVTKPGGVVVWVVGDATVNGSETGTSFRQALYFKGCGFRLHDTMIYQKPALAFPDSARYYQGFEYMFVLSKDAPKTFNPIADRKNSTAGDKVHGTERRRDGSTNPNRACLGNVTKPVGVRFNVWSIANPGKANNPHPAVFPEQLAADHIRSWSNPGDIVLDPMAGAGTVLKMARHLERRAIGIEISEKYCEIIAKRLQQRSLFETLT